MSGPGGGPKIDGGGAKSGANDPLRKSAERGANKNAAVATSGAGGGAVLLNDSRSASLVT